MRVVDPSLDDGDQNENMYAEDDEKKISTSLSKEQQVRNRLHSLNRDD